MSITTYTVAVADRGDTYLRPVGPTSNERQCLGATLRLARRAHAVALVVPWAGRQRTVRWAKRLLAKLESEQQAYEDAISAAAIDEERELLERFARWERDQPREHEELPIRTRDEALALARAMFGA